MRSARRGAGALLAAATVCATLVGFAPRTPAAADATVDLPHSPPAAAAAAASPGAELPGAGLPAAEPPVAELPGADATGPLRPSAATLSVPVRSLVAGHDAAAGAPDPAPERIDPLAGTSVDGSSGPVGRDTRPMDRLATPPAEGQTPVPSLVFDGTGMAEGCGGCAPPDPTGDVSPDHYVQMVNTTKVAIYDKRGVLQAPAFDLSTLFSSGSCSTIDRGDPQVLWDPLAGRWVLSQFLPRWSPGLCFAVSQTADPLGSYYLYEFTTPDFPDYFKVGVWPSGYYVGSNEDSYAAYAFDRDRMLSGLPATFVRVAGQTNFLLPADVDGPQPPSAAGGLFYTFKDDSFHGGTDRLEVFELTPDFGTPANSTFITIATIPITPFTYTVCGYFEMSCIPQVGTAMTVDPVSEWPMQRFAYRRFAGRETLVGTFTVGGGSGPAGAAIRWFELNDSGAGWSLVQEGTQDPGDGLDRWMGSIAMDGGGNIALGYSASSTTEFPSIRYAVRTPSDPPGTLRAEQVMRAGGGSQLATNRWGDYSAMSVDPADEHAFWYTGEYYAVSDAFGWSTSIGTFTVPWPQVIEFAQPSDVSLGDGSVSASATGGASGNPVTFGSVTPQVCTTGGVNGATVSLVAVGTCTLTADQSGNGSYTAATQVRRSFQVLPIGQVIGFAQPSDVSLGAGTVSLSATGGASGNPVTFGSVTPHVCTTGGVNGATASLLTVGTCTLTADQSGNASYAAAPQVRGSFQVLPSARAVQRPIQALGLPSRVRRSGTTRLLSLPVSTNAGQEATVRATCAPRTRVKPPTGDSGRTCRIIRTPRRLSVRLSGQPGVIVRIRIHAPAVTGYGPYMRTAIYRTRSVP